MTSPIIPWMGGKRGLATRLIPLFPPHKCYVEVFAGSGATKAPWSPPCPAFALVQGVAHASAQSGICDNFRPRYAVDLQVLAEDGELDPNLPILAGVPLPVPVGGDEMGFFAFPAEGTMVVVNFAYGMPSKPFIQTILPHGLSLPKVPKGDQVWQHSETAQQRVDADGNWSRQTDGRI